MEDAEAAAADAAFDSYAREHGVDTSSYSAFSDPSRLPDMSLTRESPPELSLNTPSPLSSAPLTSEGPSSEHEHGPNPKRAPESQHVAFEAPFLFDGAMPHTVDPHALSAWQHPPTDLDHGCADDATAAATFDEMICSNSIAPASAATPAGPPPTELSRQTSNEGSSFMQHTTQLPIPLNLQPNPAHFGVGSHYSHTSDADLGYTATTIVRPPKDQLGKLQVHVHGVALVGAKSRVETQIRMRIELVRNTPPPFPGGPDPHAGEEPAPDLGITSTQALNTARARFGPTELWQRIGNFSHIKLPPGTATRRKSRKYKAPDVDPQSTLFLDATVVTATPPHERISVCDGCRTRERKRTLRMKGRPKRKDGDTTPPKEDECPATEEMQALGIDASMPGAVDLALQAREQRAKARVVVFNTDDYVEFNNGEAVLPTRITCYCRHHKEKLGFCIIFTLRDWTGQLLATGTTPPIMITDDHKTSQTPQAQALMQAQADALTEALSRAHASNTAQLGFPAVTPPGPQPRSATPPALEVGSAAPIIDTTAGRVSQQRRKSSTVRPKPYARQSTSSSARTQRANSRLSPGASSPAPMDGLTSEQDPRTPVAQHRASPSFHDRHASISDSVSPQDALSPSPSQGTVPTGTMPFSAIQGGLSADTLQSLPMDQSPQLSSGTVDPTILMQAFMFARSQSEAATGNTMMFQDRAQPPPQLYAAMMSAMQGLNPGQWPNIHDALSPGPLEGLSSPNDSSMFFLNSNVGTPGMLNSMTPITPPPPPAPKVTQLIPREGPTTGGTEVTVLGENFVQGITVVFGDHSAISTKVWASNTLVCVLPPAASPGPVIVSLRTPHTPTPNEDDRAAPLAFFTYVEQTDRGLMELALQVVGLKMTGQVQSARDVAMRVVGHNEQGGSSSSSRTAEGGTADASEGQLEQSASQFSLLSRMASDGSRKPLSFQDTLVSLLALSDEHVPTPRPNPSKAHLPVERRGEAFRLTNRAGQTMLHLAVVLGFSRLVDDLLRRGAPVNACDQSGMTPLHFASLHGRTSVSRRLLRSFADPRARTRTGLTPLQLARMAGQEDTVDLLLEHFDLLARTLVESDTDDEWEAVDGQEFDENTEDMKGHTTMRRHASIDEDNVSSDTSSVNESEEEHLYGPKEAPQLSSEKEPLPEKVPASVKEADAIPETEKDTEAVRSGAAEKALLAASLKAKKRKFDLGRFNRFLPPAVLHTITAPLSVYRVEQAAPTFTEDQLRASSSKGKGNGKGKASALALDVEEVAPPAYEAAIASTSAAAAAASTSTSTSGPTQTPTEVRRRRRGVPEEELVTVGGTSRRTWQEDRMLVMFWLPALIIALLVCLYSAAAPFQQLISTMRRGTLFKLDP